MEEEGCPIAEEELHSDLPGLEKNRLKDFIDKNKALVISIGVGILILLSLIFIIIAVSTSKGPSKEKIEKDALGRIECKYEISTTSKATQLVYEDFTESFEIAIKINGKILKFTKSFTFTEAREQSVTFLIYSTNISIDKMFKDIILLKQANFITNKKIIL